jgi:hypothetical protein
VNESEKHHGFVMGTDEIYNTLSGAVAIIAVAL